MNSISGSLQILKRHVVGETTFQDIGREDKGGETIVFEAHCVRVFRVGKWWRVCRKNNFPDIASKKDHIFPCFFGCLPPPRSVGDFFPFKDSYLICLKPKEETKEL
ncbi:hypothetical protein V6N13_088081 [Hibiscus sabdariffa]